ncbi:MAG TPA: DUF2905 domain-containing protein [Syntrophales bacterium]|nr:DUF2905 domain-containing protein [Syntrophales bacterium]HOD97441.1 DUF2905 domain-containing protein [Syntrophales bacterium]HPN07984.1 DUF2905 domain-containing protein [Syntrophales bacterium]HPX82766.1 DUF2905 domain-containing protein [Syntrophales bacterium]HQB13764.1 DUF2905 domain-containing protein [Syntrophales bacterium]
MMNDFSQLGKILLIVGLAVAAVGLLIMLGGKLPWLGRLPGDIFYRGEKFTFYFPLTTSIIASIVLTLIIWLITRR